MGAKTPETLKLRRPSSKCEICGRKFLNIQALTSHRKYVHKMSIVTKRLRPNKRAVTVVPTAGLTTEDPPDSKKGAQMPPSKVVNKNSSKIIEDGDDDAFVDKDSTPKKFEFKCPKCVKVFGVYFSAYRHIQKTHSVDSNNRPVPPDSPRLIQPIRMELCNSCKKFYPTSEKHTCGDKIGDVKYDICACLGCQKTYEGLFLFQQHVKGFHAKKADCFFFAKMDDFIIWKTELETIAKTTFVKKTISMQNSKQIYHCSHQGPTEANKTLLCPSTINVTEINKGVQVIYFKEHFGHTCLDLPPLKYSKNSILPYLKDFAIQSIEGNEYLQFKSIINNVTACAAKVDIGVLYTLLEKALEMAVLLNLVSLDDQTVVNKSMTDDQITEALSTVKTVQGRRKQDLNQLKQEVDKNENLKTTPVINKPVINKVGKKAVETLPTTPVNKSFAQSSPSSFNDSYKDFVDQNFKTSLSDDNSTKNSAVKKKVVVKTKIGQFKARPSLSPKIEAEPVNTLTPIVDDDPAPSPKRAKLSLSPKRSKVTVSPKTITPIAKPVQTPKIIKPKPTPKPTPVKHKEYKINPDFKYEVREQENDCNILILKF